MPMLRPSALLLLLASTLHAQEPSAERLRADVKFLASDRLEGRGPGTSGEELTIEHLAKEFARAGLKPAGDKGTFFQTVPLLTVTTGKDSTLSALGKEKIDFALETEFAGTSKTQKGNEDFDAEAIFLGHGITAPEFQWDDYAGVDVKGKVVVVFTNEPPSEDPAFFKGKTLTYYGRWSYKFEEAARRGAKAVLIIHTNETAGYPYSVVKKLEGSQIPLAPDAPALAFAGWLSRQAGEKLLGLAGLNVDGALKAAGTKGFKAVPLGVRIQGHIASSVRKIASKNVIGLAEGSDPNLKSEAVIFTAHWDHLGVGKAGLGDVIYNGAADNATGSAMLMEMARLWGTLKPRPKRSALFLATTAEEQGLLGAVYYARHPSIPLGKTALNLNFDMIPALGVPESIVVTGAERTTAWPLVQTAAKKHRLEIEADRVPHLGLFFRSDHFALARHGVPAFSVSLGEKIQGMTAAQVQQARAEFIGKIYHTPADEYRESWNFAGYPVLIRFALDLAQDAANAAALPTWNPGDEFRAARDQSWQK